jgi:hypothetical protein
MVSGTPSSKSDPQWANAKCNFKMPLKVFLLLLLFVVFKQKSTHETTLVTL